MIETLINNSALIQLIATIVNAIAIVVLVIVTWTYTKATKGMADTMYKQFIYEHKPYLSMKYYQKEPNTAPVLEYWHVVRLVELKGWTIMPLNFKLV